MGWQDRSGASVWCLEWWDDTLSDVGTPGWRADGFRTMDFTGEVFSDPADAKRYVAEANGYDVRWFSFRPDRWCGRTRGKDTPYAGGPDRPTYFILTRYKVMG